MWKQRKLDKAREEEDRTRRIPEKRRRDSPPSKDQYVTGYWNKKLMEMKESDKSK